MSHGTLTAVNESILISYCQLNFILFISLLFTSPVFDGPGYPMFNHPISSLLWQFLRLFLVLGDLEALTRYFVECPSTGICLKILVILGLWDLGSNIMYLSAKSVQCHRCWPHWDKDVQVFLLPSCSTPPNPHCPLDTGKKSPQKPTRRAVFFTSWRVQ